MSIQIGQKVSNFSASSTEGLFNLEDYAGKWTLLLCNPSNFNTWRKNEFLALIKYQKFFTEKNIHTVAISTDENASHLPWFYSMVRLNNYAMPFPILDDRKGNVAHLLGLSTHPETRSAEGTQAYLIAPDGTLAQNFTFTGFGKVQIQEILHAYDQLKDTYPLNRTEVHNLSNQPPATNPLCPTKPIVGEYVLGNPENVDAMLLDFVVYAFALINDDGTFTVYSTKYLKDLVNLKLENPYLRVILAIGGWGADGFSQAASTPAGRYAFAREAQKWVKEYDLDGIDIDWEYPGVSASGIKSSPNDKENFTLLLTALRDVLGEDTWISVAGTGDPAYIRNVEIANIAPIINYFNLMAYDFTAGETGPNGAKHQSNLYPSALALNGMSVDGQINNLEAAGMPSNKINMGLPFYGRYGATDTKTFDELRKNFINKNGYKVLWDNAAKAPYIVDPNGNFAYSYDNLLSIYFKGLYVVENCLGGLFSWQSGMDKANILANGMSQAIRDSAGLEDLLKQSYYLDK